MAATASAVERIDRLVVRLAPPVAGRVQVTAEHNGERVAEVPGGAVLRNLPLSYAAFLRGEPKDMEMGGRSFDSDLVELGGRLGAVLFPGPVGEALAGLLDRPRVGVTVELIFEAPSELLSLPFEAARLADGRLPALEGGVCVLRRLLSERPAAMPPWVPLAGPLKILVAVGAPDEGQTPNQALDLEGELQAMLDAVEHANRLGDTQMRVLEVGHPDEIQRALTSDVFHVLHLSGHGSPGAIELETEEGAPCRVTASELVRRLIETGRPLPLVFVSTCHGSDAGTDTASFAQGLIEAGIQSVVSMQGWVSDAYATRLAGEFYGSLAAAGDRPLASRALARARRSLERKRLEALARGGSPERHRAEYATASLFCRGSEQPLLDLTRDREPLHTPPVHRVDGPVPQLSLGELIGRRRELRDLLRTLRDHPQAIAAAGRRAGVVLTGMGGVGKSCLAGRAMARLVEEGWAVAAVRDRFDPGAIARAAAEAVRQIGWPEAQADVAALASDDVLDVRKLEIVGRLLRRRRLTLVLDNFETNLRLTESGAEYRDTLVRDVVRALCEATGTGKLLLTCRYPLPGLGAWLREIPVGPLSRAETSKLLLRLDGFARHDSAEVNTVVRQIGGHPRMLEYVDGLVRGNAARLPQVRELLEKHAREAGVDLSAAVHHLTAAAREALLIGAQDILLAELLALAAATGDAEVLRQAAVSSLPLRTDDLARALEDRPATPVEVTSVRASLSRLAGLSLVTPVAGDQICVHRWTATSLRGSSTEAEHRERCRRAGEVRLWRLQTDTHSFEDGTEAVENLLDAGTFDRASEIAVGISKGLEQSQHLASAATFAGWVLSRLPETSMWYWNLADNEACALMALGYTQRAHARFESLLSLLESKVGAEADRIEYQRDLSATYERIGDVQRVLGEGAGARVSYERSMAIRNRLVEVEPGRGDYQRDLAVSYDRIGDVQAVIGEGAAARVSYERSMAIRDRLAAVEPGRGDYQRDLAVSYDRIGDVQAALGEGTAARVSYERSMAIRQRLIKAEPDRADYQSGLAMSYSQIGDLQMAAGRGAAARASYERSMEIRDRLAHAEPSRTDYQRDLALVYDRIGDVQRIMGEGASARTSYMRSLAISEKLAAAEPDRTDYQRDLAVSYDRIGDVQSDLGEREQMRASYEQSLSIRERLVAIEPNRADHQHHLSVSYIKVGDAQTMQAEWEEACASFERALAIMKQLAAAEPGRADYQRDLALPYERLADAHRALGDGEAALASHELALGLRERLVAIEPSRADYRHHLSVSYTRIGQLRRALGQVKAARAAFERSIANRQRLASAEPDRADHQREMSVSYNSVGDMQAILGEQEAALASYERSLATIERLVAAEPGRADYQRDLAVSYERLGNAQRVLGEGGAARASYELALGVRERLVATEPSRADYQRELSVSYNKVGDVQAMRGELEAALASYEQSLAIIERLVAAEPDRADYQRELAVSYERLGDAQGALGQKEPMRASYEQSLAIRERLVASAPGRVDFQRDLSVSCNRAGYVQRALGDRKAARASYERALAIRERLASAEPGRPGFQYDLAVACNNVGDLLRELGEERLAGASYERSLAIMERLTAAEPNRADFQRVLAMSNEGIGDVRRDLGEQQQAHSSYRRSLAIRERLTAAEPGRADLAQDLASSLIKMARLDLARPQPLAARALQVLQGLHAQNRLDARGASLLRQALALDRRTDPGPPPGDAVLPPQSSPPEVEESTL